MAMVRMLRLKSRLLINFEMSEGAVIGLLPGTLRPCISLDDLPVQSRRPRDGAYLNSSMYDFSMAY